MFYVNSVFCWVSFTAILGRMHPVGAGQTPGLGREAAYGLLGCELFLEDGTVTKTRTSRGCSPSGGDAVIPCVSGHQGAVLCRAGVKGWLFFSLFTFSPINLHSLLFVLVPDVQLSG